jgi:hypothetical protein
MVEGFPPRDVNGERLDAVAHPAMAALNPHPVAVAGASQAFNAPPWRRGAGQDSGPCCPSRVAS